MANPLQFEVIERPSLPRAAEGVESALPVREALRRIPRLRANEVHTASFSLAQPPDVLAACEEVLSDEEHDRARKFHFEVHRARFVAGRGLLRFLLGHYLQAHPARLIFSYGANGKPALQGQEHELLHFNLAHSESLALLGITRLGPLGVDVERVRDLPDFEKLVSCFFSVREAAAFARLPPNQRAPAFFNLWTRKEAWLKATGEGIAHRLDKVEVSFLPGEPARLLALPEPNPVSGWTLRDLQPADGFVGALAMRQSRFTLRSFELEQ